MGKFVCNVNGCQAQYGDREQVKRHRSESHSLGCWKCGAGFANKQALQAHIRNRHPAPASGNNKRGRQQGAGSVRVKKVKTEGVDVVKVSEEESQPTLKLSTMTGCWS